MKHYLLIISIVLFLLSCEEEKFEVPKPISKEVPEGELLKLAAITNLLDRSEPEKTAFFEVENQFVEGYVVSSDENGNFFKELTIQDKAENPQSGINILIDERSLYQRFPFGSKIRVRLQGLSLGYKNGILVLGKQKDDEITTIDVNAIDNHLFRSGEIKEIQPLSLPLEELTFDKLNLYVNMETLQFNQNLLVPLPKTLAGESEDRFDALRPLEHCSSGVEIALCTSTFSSFKSSTLPKGSGQVTGVLSRDFGDDIFVIKLNTILGLTFKDETRCDNQFYNCNSATLNSEEILFKEDFETITNENKLDPLGWINVNVTGDEKRWQDKKVTNIDNRTLSISAFNSNLRPLEAWLITPEIDISKIENPYLQFRVRTRFNNGRALKVYVSNTFEVESLTENWELLDLALPVNSSNFKTFKVPLACVKGKTRVAFQYKGFDPVITSTYEIDDVIFYGNKLE